MSGHPMYPGGFNWGSIPEEDRATDAGVRGLEEGAFCTTCSECIVASDDEIIDVMRRVLGPEIAAIHAERPYPGGPPMLFALVGTLIMKDLARMLPDDSVPSGRRLVLYHNPATGQELWR